MNSCFVSPWNDRSSGCSRTPWYVCFFFFCKKKWFWTKHIEHLVVTRIMWSNTVITFVREPPAAKAHTRYNIGSFCAPCRARLPSRCSSDPRIWSIIIPQTITRFGRCCNCQSVLVNFHHLLEPSGGGWKKCHSLNGDALGTPVGVDFSTWNGPYISVLSGKT